MKKKRMPSYRWCEIYKENFYFHIGWPGKDFLEYARKEYNYNRDSLGDGVCLEIQKSDRAKGIVIWTRKRSSAAIAHESTHAALFIFEERGFCLSYLDHEPFCYLVEYISRLAWESGK